MRQTIFMIAVVTIASVMLATLMFAAPRPQAQVEKLTVVPAIKEDRIRTAFAGMPPPPEPFVAIPVRVIPISRQAMVSGPTTPELLTRVATALPNGAEPQVEPVEPSHAVSVPETAAPLPSEEADPPRHRTTDACAARGMRKIELRHGWRCVHARR